MSYDRLQGHDPGGEEAADSKPAKPAEAPVAPVEASKADPAPDPQTEPEPAAVESAK